MPNFRYKVRDKYGRGSAGIMEGESGDAVALRLKHMGYTPTLIEKAGPGLKKFNSLARVFHRVNSEELIVFTNQLMTLQRAGVPILVSLESISEQSNNHYFKKIIDEISRDIEAGKSFSEAIAKFPGVFSDVYMNMIRSGEAAGILDSILQRLATLLENEQGLAMKIKQATRYPLLVVASIAVAFPMAVMFIIPKFSAIYARFNAGLPLPTRMLLGMHSILSHYWPLAIVGLFIFIMALKYFISTSFGRAIWDGIKLKVPVFGQLNLKISMSRFCRMTSVLSASGIPIINTLEIVKGSVGNKIIADSIEHIIEGISEGEGMTGSMKASGLFPSIVLQMVKIGEETGKIDELLMKVADYYDAQIEHTIANLTVLIEPFLIFIMGMLVLILALAIFLPMWSLISVFRM
ncbi:MAG: type II secretion system F family protein [Candidatus Omnitrophica bacterium]|nr:type II secretion system F family protein [Candidatus Omnitrophota bacterium]